jgi:trehalose 6-phosphate synthase
VSYRRTGSRLVPTSVGPGGLVPVMRPVLKRFGGRWIVSAFSDDDRAIARTDPRGHEYDGFTLQLLDVPADVHRGHYETVSVEYLGRLFHYLFELPYLPVFDDRFSAAWGNFQRVNELYAHAVARAPGDAPVLVEDYHLMLVAQRIRTLIPSFDRPLVYFHHVPWCAPDYFGLLPRPIRSEILSALLSYDAVGFHSHRWARAFLDCCERFVAGARVEDGSVEWNGRSIRVLSSPAPIDPAEIKRAATSHEAHQWFDRLTRLVAGRTAIVRVDRADLWKNVLRGFEAFGLLLRRRPELASHVCFIAVLSPTRTWLTEYRRYLRACERAAARINQTFDGTRRGHAPPVEILVAADGLRPDHHRALSAMRVADALLVNPLYDGLNLVAKEAVIVSERAPVLVLSENAGSYDELADGALCINPFDVTETAHALERALEMDAEERSRRADALRRIILARTPESWIDDQLGAVGAGTSSRTTPKKLSR